LKNIGYYISIIGSLILYFIISFFVPKIDTLTYAEYKRKVENSTNTNITKKEVTYAQENENINVIIIKNIEEISSKYDGEIPLFTITSILMENINTNFKGIKLKEIESGVNETFANNKDMLEKYFGITNKTELSLLLNKIKSLKNNNIISARIEENSCVKNEKHTMFSLIIKLSNNEEIKLNVKISNYAKTAEKNIEIS